MPSGAAASPLLADSGAVLILGTSDDSRERAIGLIARFSLGTLG